MEFRRNGLRDERRRRVLIDETLHAAEEADASDATAPAVADVARTPTKPYSDAAIASSQTPVTYFLPKRPIILWSVWFIGLALIGVIQLLYRYVFVAATPTLRDCLTSFDVLARGSLASWFAGVVLAVSAFASLLVYQIRRHRTDDYRGRYRWWLWLVPLLLLLSVSASTGWHEALSGTLTAMTGAEVAVGGKGWWLLAYGALFFPIVLQLAIEVWPSRMATTFLVATVAAYGVVATFQLGAWPLTQAHLNTIFQSSLLLSAHLGVLLTVMAYGRYVYLDAHNELAARKKWLKWPKRRRKASSTKEPAAAKKSSRKAKQVRVDEPHEKFGQEKAAPPSVTLKPDVSQYDDEDELEIGGRKLSKAERRRLRKDTQRS
jgi:hypothetical protein